MTAEETDTLCRLLTVSAAWVTGCPSIPFSAKNWQTVHTQPDTASALRTLAEEIASCSQCQLCSKRRNTVPGMGCTAPAVMVIGEGPGADEDASGKPFVGRAGQLLDKMLAAISLSRTSNCFIANIVKCRPPNNRDPLPEESAACRRYLDTQVMLLKPAIILAVGRIAAQNLLNTDAGIGKLRGRFMEYKGIPLMATYHPSALLRNAELKRPAWEDLKAFRSRLLQILPDYAAAFLKETQRSPQGA